MRLHQALGEAVDSKLSMHPVRENGSDKVLRYTRHGVCVVGKGPIMQALIDFGVVFSFCFVFELNLPVSAVQPHAQLRTGLRNGSSWQK